MRSKVDDGYVLLYHPLSYNASGSQLLYLFLITQALLIEALDVVQ